MTEAAQKPEVLIVDDDPNICEVVRLYLNREGYLTRIVHDGAAALTAVEESLPSLIILDIMLPEHDGWEICQRLREEYRVPIIMLTALGESTDRIAGLNLGADDYMVKPFDPNELVARVNAVLRRSAEWGTDTPEALHFEGLEVRPSQFEVLVEGAPVELAPKEFELLHHLVSRPNRVFTRDQLLEAVWGYDYVGQSRTVDVHIQRLRKKLGLAGSAEKETCWDIVTVWGVGYKFEVEES